MGPGDDVARLGRSHRSYWACAARQVGAAGHRSSDPRSHRLWSGDARDRRRGVVGRHQLCPYRAVAPFEVVFVDASPWLFAMYRVFTRAAFIIFGVVLLLSGYPRWLGWMLIVSGAIMFADLVAQVLPPFVHYVVFLILGAALLILRPPPRPRSFGTGVEGSRDPEPHDGVSPRASNRAAEPRSGRWLSTIGRCGTGAPFEEPASATVATP
jgi:hypothetical protein